MVVIGLILAWVGVFFEVDSAVEAKQKETNGKKADIDKATASPKATIGLYEKRLTEFDALRTQKWQATWDDQKSLYTWPDLGKDNVAYLEKLKFGDEIKGGDVNGVRVNGEKIRDLFRDKYLELYSDLAAEVLPLRFGAGGGVAAGAGGSPGAGSPGVGMPGVGPPGGGLPPTGGPGAAGTPPTGDSWEAVLRYVSNWGSRTPESEDIWLAIEDYWVQRDVVRALAGVNAELANMKPLPGGASVKDEPLHRTFENRTWRAELWVADEDGKKYLKGKLWNLTDRLQPLGASGGMVLRVWLKDDPKETDYFDFLVEGVAIKPWVRGEQDEAKNNVRVIKTIPQHLLPAGRIEKLAKVEQVFDVRTVPLRSVERLALGKPAEPRGLSARHADRDLDMSLFSKKKAAEQTGATAAGSSGGKPSPGGPPGPGPVGSGGPVGPGGPGVGSDASASGENTLLMQARKRYLGRTDHVRRMPVAFTVVVDQTYIQDVLTAFANVRLRFQITQDHWKRFGGNLSYANTYGAPPAGGAGPMPGPGPVPGGTGPGPVRPLGKPGAGTPPMPFPGSGGVPAPAGCRPTAAPTSWPRASSN